MGGIGGCGNNQVCGNIGFNIAASVIEASHATIQSSNVAEHRSAELVPELYLFPVTTATTQGGRASFSHLVLPASELPAEPKAAGPGADRNKMAF